MKRSFQIPFYFGGFNHFEIVIINDVVVGGLSSPIVGLYQFKSFHLIHQLHYHVATKDVIPLELDPFIKDNIKFHTEIDDSSFLIKNGDYNINAQVTINDNSKFPVLISKFELNSTSVSHQVKLTALDAFMLFANLCANSCNHNFAEMMRMGFIHNFDGSRIEQEIRERKPLVDANPLNYNVYWFYVELFSAKYIQYLKLQMENGELHPRDILMLSGTPTLALLVDDKIVTDFANEVLHGLIDNKDFSLNEQIIYLNFLYSIRNWTRYYYTLEEFLKEHKSQFKMLKETVLKNVPKIERIMKY